MTSASKGRVGTRLALAMSFAQRHCVLLIRIGTLSLLARLLSPEEHGIFAGAFAVVSVATLFADMGIQQYLIRLPNLTEAARRSALGLGLAAACGGTAAILAVCGLAPKTWLGAPARWTLGVLALTLLLQPLNAQAMAVLQREMRFGRLYWVALSGALANTTVAVGLAVIAAGALSLAAGAVAEAAAIFALLRLAVRLPHPSPSGWGAILRFGGVFAAFHIALEASGSLINIVVGGLLGFGAVGVLARAIQVTALFQRSLIDAISPVVLPVLAERQRAGGDLASLYLRQVSCLAVLAWPFFGSLAAFAEPVVRLLLGPGWEGAVPVVRILAMDGLFLPLAQLTTPYLVAFDLLGRLLPTIFVLQAMRLLGAALASTVTLEAVCAVVVAEGAIRMLFVQRLLSRALGYRHTDALRALACSAPPSLACVGAALAGAAVLRGGAAASPWMMLPAATLAGATAWLAVLLLMGRHPLAEEIRRLTRPNFARF